MVLSHNFWRAGLGYIYIFIFVIILANEMLAIYQLRLWLSQPYCFHKYFHTFWIMSFSGGLLFMFIQGMSEFCNWSQTHQNRTYLSSPFLTICHVFKQCHWCCDFCTTCITIIHSMLSVHVLPRRNFVLKGIFTHFTLISIQELFYQS